MASFMGMFNYSIDSKGRINIPSKLRKCLNPEAKDTFVLTKGLDKCIYIFPLDEWNDLENKIKTLNVFNKDDRFFRRTWLMWATQQELDAQSRITLSKELMDYANIKSDATIIGNMNIIEVWDPETYNGYMNSHTESYEEVAERVMGINHNGG
jgi:MraZ protein